MIGRILAHYTVETRLGVGGMGEVYQASDARLGRRVAVKVLPDAFAGDQARIARLQREAKVLASLNHPNIAALYGLEQIDGVHFLVMELVDGETLAERIARGPIETAAALTIALQIADAMESAHERGVIHRDLKPANVKITADGKVKVLDFGLAKAMENPASQAPPENPSQSPTLSFAGTNAGVILGTAAYMSPEQANGFAVDTRSDIFSFGCVLYEMLTGRKAFIGETVSEILASVLAREPDFSQLSNKLNSRIYNLIRRCLEKNTKRRWQAIGDVRIELEAILADPAGLFPKTDTTAATAPFWKRLLPVIGSALVFGAIGSVLVWYLKPDAVPVTARYAFRLPEGQQLSGAGGRDLIAISPDGTMFAYSANRRLYLKRLRDLESFPIQGSANEQGVTNPVFSPDGKSIAYWSGGDQAINRIAIEGGKPVMVCASANPAGISWDAENYILFALPTQGIMRVSATGGVPEKIVDIKEPEQVYGSQMLPGGKAVMFTLNSVTVGADRWSKAKIVVQTLSSGERTILVDGGTAGRYVTSGHLVYDLNGVLMARRFNVRTLSVMPDAVPVIESLRDAATMVDRTASRGSTGMAHYGFSKNGSLIYVPGGSTLTEETVLQMADRKGTAKSLITEPSSYAGPRISPDGKQLVFWTEVGKEQIVSLYDLARTSSVRRLTFGGSNRQPIWSADGNRILYSSDRDGGGIYWQNIDGTGTERLTTLQDGTSHAPLSWIANTRQFLFAAVGEKAGTRMWTYSVPDHQGTPTQLRLNADPALSRDGHWVAYQSTTAFSTDIFVQPYPATGAIFQITKQKAQKELYHHPLWSPDGKELFFVGGQMLYSVTIQYQPSFSFSEPTATPISGFVQASTSARDFDITPDGKQFVMVFPSAQTPADSRATAQIHVVLNWFEELKQRVGSK